MNLYVYTGNNPVNFTDPTGHDGTWANGAPGATSFFADPDAPNVLDAIGFWWGLVLNGCDKFFGASCDDGITVATMLFFGAPSRPTAFEEGLSSVELGFRAEAALVSEIGGNGTIWKRFATNLGTRIVDYFSEGVAYESKGGFVKWSSSFAKQADKDAALLADPNSPVNKVVWYFWKGADQKVLDYLDALGIEYVIKGS